MKKWVPTHPDRTDQIRRGPECNNEWVLFVQTVKMAKHWRDGLPSAQAQPTSYIVESLVAETLGASAPTSHAAAALKVFEGIWTRYGASIGTGRVPTITDPGYSAVNVAKRWQVAEFDGFMRYVRYAAATARDAYDELDLGRSVAAWRRLFGNEFSPI